MIKQLFIVLYVFILFFSPKFGLFDPRVLMVPIGFMALKKSLFIPKFINKLLIHLLILMLYYSIISFLNNSGFEELLRYFRVIISVVLIIFLFSFPNVDRSLMVNSILIALMSNIVVMIFNLISPSFNLLIQSIYLDGGKILDKSNRVIGLSSGYDTTGVIVLISILFLTYLFSFNRNKIYFIFLLLSIGVSFFISRGTMVYFFLILLFFIFRITKKLNLKFVLLIYFFAILFLSLVYPYVYNVFISSVNLDFLNLETEVDPLVIENQYAKTDFLGMVESFLKFPNSAYGIIFGEAHDVDVDSGYIKTINQIGILGTLYSLYINWEIYFLQNKFKNKIFFTNNLLMLLCIILISLTNFKNQMFFTRGIFEIYLVLAFLSHKYYAKS
jgi:hypothetical protein